MGADLERCANCDQVIGRLETPYLWQQTIVCQSCLAKLSSRQPGPQITPPEAPTNLCPSCGSSHLVKCSVVHESGTSTTLSMGLIGGDVHGDMLGIGRSQTNLAKRCAPPRHPSFIWVVLPATVAGLLLLRAAYSFYQMTESPLEVSNPASSFYSRSAWQGEAILLLLLASGLIAVAVALVAQYRSSCQNYNRNRATWEKLWLCQTCGEQCFFPHI